ncbi:hypothetical protein FRB99_003609 [Tulasnella sp. 403]|nr:hypothetical protein FRB99_003609 [Tulasnella sp. 403]
MDILLLGATGYTGRLILQYLASHPSRKTLTESKVNPGDFTLGVGGRSLDRVRRACVEFSLKEDHDVKLLQVDTLDEKQVREAVKGFRVVISAVGPFWKYGKAVVAACAELGVHYVDTTGETYFIKHCVERYDYLATKTHAIIINAGGFDSVPSDMSAFLGVQNLRNAFGAGVQAGQSMTAFHCKYADVSGGTMDTIFDITGGAIPKNDLVKIRNQYSLSPLEGVRTKRFRYVYSLPFTNILGCFFPMSPGNTQIVRRTWGLLASRERAAGLSGEPVPSNEAAYGSRFTYEECSHSRSRVSAMITSFALIGGLTLLFFAPLRWIAKTFLFNKPGQGPSDKELEAGWMRVINVTTTAPANNEPVQAVKTIIKGTGEPGYYLTAVMVSEIAFGLLPPNRAHLTSFGREGGVLTSMSALGLSLVERLKATGKFDFESEIISDGVRTPSAFESRKTR